MKIVKAILTLIWFIAVQTLLLPFKLISLLLTLVGKIVSVLSSTIEHFIHAVKIETKLQKYADEQKEADRI